MNFKFELTNDSGESCVNISVVKCPKHFVPRLVNIAAELSSELCGTSEKQSVREVPSQTINEIYAGVDPLELEKARITAEYLNGSKTKGEAILDLLNAGKAGKH